MSRTEQWAEWCASLQARGIDPSRIEIANGRGLEITVTHTGREAAWRVYNPDEIVTDAGGITTFERHDRRKPTATIHVELIRGTFAIVLHQGKVAAVTLKASGVDEERLFAELDRLGYSPEPTVPAVIKRFQELAALREAVGKLKTQPGTA